MHIIIDGYNLIRQSDTLRRFEKSSLEEARRALVRFLLPYRQARNHRMTIVFDGWKSGSPLEERDREGGMDIVYSCRGITADDVIKRLAATSGEEILVVTSDRDIASFVERRGKTAISSHDFEDVISMKTWETTPTQEMGKDKDEEEDDHGPPGTRKKGTAKRVSRRERDYRKRINKL